MWYHFPTMKLYEKITIILGSISMALLLWHVFTPRNLHIDGFMTGNCLIVCGGLIGLALAIGLEQIDKIDK